MSKKHVFLQFFSKIAIFACVFCAFFIPSAFATLPAGYTELEYIESTGTQYIDTGIKTNNNLGIHIDFQYTVQNTNEKILFEYRTIQKESLMINGEINPKLKKILYILKFLNMEYYNY